MTPTKSAGVSWQQARAIRLADGLRGFFLID